MVRRSFYQVVWVMRMVETPQKSLMIPVGADGKTSSHQLPRVKSSTATFPSWNMSLKLQALSTVQQDGLTASKSMHGKPSANQNSSINATSDLSSAGALPKWSNKSSVLERYAQATIHKTSPSSGFSLLSEISFQPESDFNTSQLSQYLELNPPISATGGMLPGNYTDGYQAACLWSASASPIVLTSDPQLGCGTLPWDDPEGECQLDTLYVTLAPSEACCTRCFISAKLPSMAYIPSPDIMITAGNGYVTSNDTRMPKSKSTQHPQAASNSVYVLYDEVLATYECGLNKQQIGAKHTSVTLGPYNPSDLSTMNACNKFSFQSLIYSQISSFTTSLSYSCTVTYSGDIYYAPVAFISQGSAVAFPFLKPPSALISMNSLWKHCTVERDSVALDPPLALSTVPDLGPGTIGSFLTSLSARPGSTFTPSYPTKTVQDYAAPIQRSSGPSMPAETLGAVASHPTDTEIPGSYILPPQETMSQSIDPIILEESGDSETQNIIILDSQQFPPAEELIPGGQALPRVVSMTRQQATGSWPNPIILISDSPALYENNDLIIESSTIIGEDFNHVSPEPEPSSKTSDPKGNEGPPPDPLPITPVASTARSDNSFAVAPTATLLADSQSTIDGHSLLIPITLASYSILHEGSDGGLILPGATIRPGIQTAYASHLRSAGSSFVVIDRTENVLAPTSSLFSLEIQAVDEAPGGGLGLGSATVRPGFQMTFEGYSLSLGSKTIEVDGSLYTWLQSAPSVPVDGGSRLEVPGLVDPAGQDESSSQGQVSTYIESYVNQFGLSEGSLITLTAVAMAGVTSEINRLSESTFDNVTAPAKTITDNTTQRRDAQLSSDLRSSKASKARPSKSGTCRLKASYSLPAFGLGVGIYGIMAL